MNKDNSELLPDPDSKLELIFREHWHHARHCENERIQFTSIYAAIVTAILYFIRKADCSYPRDIVPILLLVLFGLVLSIIGFLIVITLSLGYEHHITDIYMIFYRWNKMEFYRHPPKPIYFMNIHRWFYEITIALFAALLLYYGFDNWTFLVVSVIIFVHIEGFYQLWWKKYIEECWEFEAALRSDTEGRYRKEWDKWFNPLDFRRRIVEDYEAQKKRRRH